MHKIKRYESSMHIFIRNNFFKLVYMMRRYSVHHGYKSTISQQVGILHDDKVYHVASVYIHPLISATCCERVDVYTQWLVYFLLHDIFYMRFVPFIFLFMFMFLLLPFFFVLVFYFLFSILFIYLV